MSKFLRRLEENYNSAAMPSERKVFQHKAYYKHFEGYTEKKVTDEKGRSRTIRVYEGKYYQQKLTPVQYAVLRIVYFLCMAAGVFLFWKGTIFTRDSNYVPFIILAESVTGLMILWSFFVLLIYLMTPKKNDSGDYNASSISFCKAHRNVIIGLLVIIGFTAGYDLLHISRSSTDDLICILLFLFCGIMFFAVKWLEEHIEYIIVSEAS